MMIEPTVSQQEIIAHYLLAGVAPTFGFLALAAITLWALLVGAWERLFKLEETCKIQPVAISISRSPFRLGLLLIPLVLVCFALSPTARAVDPNGDTAEGDGAPQSLTTGPGNTALGFHARFSQQPSKFAFRDASGKTTSVDVIETYQPKKIVRPFAKIDRQVDPKLMRAATIAEERAHAHSRRQCWHYVKEALLASGVIRSRPTTAYAKQAGQELVNNFGFKKLAVSDPYQAPIGSVLVYNANRAAGHVEIRTKDGFVSDFRSKTPSRRPLLGVFVKWS